MKVFALVLCLVAAATARMAYRFSDGYLDVLGAEPVQNFDCAGRSYGYYADVSTDCQVFHVCLPITDDAGELAETAHFSFFCGNSTRFDQESLTCNHEDFAFPCQEAETLYELSNADFGRIPEGGFDVVLEGSSNVAVPAPAPATVRAAARSEPIPAVAAAELAADAEAAEADAEDEAEEAPAAVAPVVPIIPASVPVLTSAADTGADADADADAETNTEAADATATESQA